LGVGSGVELTLGLLLGYSGMTLINVKISASNALLFLSHIVACGHNRVVLVEAYGAAGHILIHLLLLGLPAFLVIVFQVYLIWFLLVVK
jgi:hypothetical protein